MRNALMGLTIAAALSTAYPTTNANAAVFTFGIGAQGPLFGGYGCADVQGANPAAGAPLTTWDCHAGGNQQFDLNGRAIHGMALQRCWHANALAAGAPVSSQACNGSPNQQWYYIDGFIRHWTTGLCLDAGAGGNGTPLRIQPCNAAANNQRWQIK